MDKVCGLGEFGVCGLRFREVCDLVIVDAKLGLGCIGENLFAKSKGVRSLFGEGDTGGLGTICLLLVFEDSPSSVFLFKTFFMFPVKILLIKNLVNNFLFLL